MEEDLIWKQGLKRGEKQIFSLIFQTYYKGLVIYTGRYLSDQAACEDIVQNVFLKLWNDRETISIENSLRSYLLRAVINQCIDELRHTKIIDEYQEYLLSFHEEEWSENSFLYSELSGHIDKALNKLPEELRHPFVMSRIEGKKYSEIAQSLNVSVRTIEVRIAKALMQLRILLKDFITILISFFIVNNP